MAIVIVDGKEIEIADDERLNGVQIAARAGVEVPHYCWHPGLSVAASCRMCLVEMGRRNPKTGAIEMLEKLVPACQTPAEDGVVFVTDSPKVEAARAMVEEDLLLRHPIDCPICDKAGECLLQDYHFQHGREERRADIKPFTSRRRELGDTVTLFVDRCVMCSRCVRFCREVAGSSELMVSGRGAREEIDVVLGFPLDNKLSGNVVDLCPVGALGDRDFLYQQRVWFLKSHSCVCAGCSQGCSIFVQENQDRVYRLKPRANPAVNQWWMCDDGRTGWKYVHDENRLVTATRREGLERAAVDWSQLPEELDQALRAAGGLAAVISPHLTVEEAFLLAKYIRRLDPESLLVVGAVPQVGQDETFFGGFTIRAEKCPNRRGVELVLASFGGHVATWDEFLSTELGRRRPQGVWVSGGYPAVWNDEPTALKFVGLKLLVVQDVFASPITEHAHYVLPGAAFVERAGSFVNQADWLQTFDWSIRPPAGVMVEGRLYWRLLGEQGMYDARAVMDEASRQAISLSAASSPPPELGVDLKVNQLA